LNGLADARPLRGRPHWWAVLAVALALMALVAASATGNRVGSRSGRDAGGVHREASRTTTTTSSGPGSANASGSAAGPSPGTASGSTSGTAKSTGAGPTVSTALPPASAAGGSSAGDAGTTLTGTGVGTTTTAPVTTTTIATSDPGVGSSPTKSSTHEVTEQGYLAPPDDAEVDYPFSASGSDTVSATWSSPVSLDLTVTCPDADRTLSAVSSVTIVLPDAQGSCQAVLSEPADEDATVTYSLTIGPSDDS
jgi:hypothetical protein